VSNKQIIKNVFDEKINKDEIFKNVINSCNKEKKYFKFTYILATACLIGLIYFTSDKIQINEIKNYGIRTMINISENKVIQMDYLILNEIDIPQNFKLESSYSNSKENTVIYSHENKYIKINFSKENIIKDIIKEKDKKSKIYQTSVNIYKYDDKYINLFKKNNIYFNIEGNVDKNDIISLIKSIVK